MSSWLSAPTSNTSLAWSLGNGGKGRFVIKFPSDLSWYKEQPCTRFQSLHHRKERSGLRHEFIALQLLDGSICRLERMGDPYYRVEALSVQGTTAHDIAQCFRPDQIAEACLDSSDIVTDLTLPESLDLLDVLRICRAIQEGDKTCKYTLLGSNCYFFCLAIQACLTRLVANFEIRYPSENWISVLNRSLDELASSMSSAGHPEAILQRLHSMFPGSTSLVDRTVAEIKPKIDASLLQAQINRVLEAELWHSNIGYGVDLVIEKLVQQAIVHVLEQDAYMHNTSSNPSPSQHSSIPDVSPTYLYRQALARLVSLAVRRHERRVGNKRKDFRRDPTSESKVENLDFHPPSITLQLASSSWNKSNQFFPLIRHALAAVPQFFSIGLGFLVQTLSTKYTPGAFVDDDIFFQLKQGPSSPDLEYVTEIICKAYDLYEQNEAAEWREPPWAFVHSLIHWGSPEYVHVADEKLLTVAVLSESGADGTQNMPISVFQQYLLNRIRGHVQSIRWYSPGSQRELHRELKEKLFQVWLLMRSDDSPVLQLTTRQASYLAINQIISEMHSLVSSFQCPHDLEFDSAPPYSHTVPKLTLSPKNQPLLEQNQKLESLQMRLDDVESHGDADVRYARKEANAKVERALDDLKRAQAIVWNNRDVRRTSHSQRAS
ncbi:hypothetical protein BDV93DRAFT_612258 [Ceratobasidium sp. AG-I]|nr:hypothetical protein BDV93DRAFT_612258 [Ceratobasidium sp. AG-I]